jgi:two-component system nitrogen regulation sensor histidine kinase NtrY
MKLRSIKFRIVIRILLLAISLTLVIFLFVRRGSTLQGLYTSIIPIALTIELILYIDRNNRRMLNYLEAIEWDDMGVKMPEDMADRSFVDLNRSLNLFNKKLESLRNEKMKQFYFTEALIKDALVGLVVVDQHLKIHYVNKSFEQLLGKSRIKTQSPAEKELEEVWAQISNLDISEKRTVETEVNGQSRILLFQVSEFIIDQDRYSLYSAQNIKAEVDSTEIEAWKKLIRILSHEILNSASPILSLSGTLSEMIHDDQYDERTLLKHLEEGLDVINQRSNGLMKFTDAFSTLSKLPEPQKNEFSTSDLLQRIGVLYSDRLKEEKIGFEFTVLPEAEALFADQYQIEQVLINLVKNSIESYSAKALEKKLSIVASLQSDYVRIEVKDNGSGIPPDKMEKIFLPFFTTKERGNGIGLALSRQILNYHKGSITVDSELNRGTNVVLELPVLSGIKT